MLMMSTTNKRPVVGVGVPVKRTVGPGGSSSGANMSSQLLGSKSRTGSGNALKSTGGTSGSGTFGANVSNTVGSSTRKPLNGLKKSSKPSTPVDEAPSSGKSKGPRQMSVSLATTGEPDEDDEHHFEEEAILDDELAQKKKERAQRLMAQLDAAALQGEEGATLDGDNGTGEVGGFVRMTVQALQQHTGFDDLAIVSSTEMRVDATQDTVSVLGDWMPNLESIRLSFSVIPKLRDLGTKFSRLQVLFLNNCGVESCDGLQFHFHQLRELYLAFNKIKTLDGLIGLDNIELLDVEANFIEDFDGLTMLKSLEALEQLTLTGNPVVPAQGSLVGTKAGRKVLQNYRCEILQLAPNLTILDDIEVSGRDYDADGYEDDEGDDADNGRDGELTLPDELRELALELQAVNESVKANSGIGVEKLVEDQHRPLYSRGSMSSAGQRALPRGLSSRGDSDGIGAVPNVKGLREHQGPNSAPTLPSPNKVTQPPRNSNSGGGSSTVGSANPASSLTQSSSGPFTGSAIRNLRMAKRTLSSGGPGGATPNTKVYGTGAKLTQLTPANTGVSPSPPELTQEDSGVSPVKRSFQTPEKGEGVSSHSEVYDPDEEEQDEFDKLLLGDSKDAPSTLLESPQKFDPSAKTKKEIEKELLTGDEDEFADEVGTFDRLKKLYGYSADNKKLDTSSSTSPVLPSSETVTTSKTITLDAHLTTRDVVLAVRNQKLEDVAKVEKAIYRDAMGDIQNTSGSATHPTNGRSRGLNDRGTDDGTEFESLDINAFGGDDDEVL